MKPTSARRATRGLSCFAKMMLSWTASHSRLHRLCIYWRRRPSPLMNCWGGTKRSSVRSSSVNKSAISVAGVVVICSKKSRSVQKRWVQSISSSFRYIRWKRISKTASCLNAATGFRCCRLKKPWSSQRIDSWNIVRSYITLIFIFYLTYKLKNNIYKLIL